MFQIDQVVQIDKVFPNRPGIDKGGQIDTGIPIDKEVPIDREISIGLVQNLIIKILQVLGSL